MTVVWLGIGVVVAAMLAGLADWVLWRRARRRVERGFRTAATAMGPVPFVERGPASGDVLLISMGGGAGPDAIDAMPWFADAGYRVICPCRPGYYSVPVDMVHDLPGQGEQLAAVLEALQVKGPVHVLGISAGGPAALYYASQHPTRSLTLWSAVTGEYHPNEASMNSLLGRLILSPVGQPVLSWLLSRFAWLAPRQSAVALLEAESTLSGEAREALAREETATPEGRRRFQVFVDATTPMTEIYTGMMMELSWMADAWEPAWEQIVAPTLAIASPLDKDVPPAHTERVADKLPHARVQWANAGGHFVWWGAEGAEVIEATLDHLAAPSR